MDESGCYLLPTVVRTYAPRGQVPVLHVPLTRDHLSLIGAVTPTGRVLLQVRDHALSGPDIVRFLRHLLRHISGKLLVVWDGSPIHRAQVVQDFLARGAAKRLHLEPLPAYAPELNPAEGLCHTLKRIELRNVCCRDLAELRAQVRLATARLRHQPARLRGYVRHCACAPEPLVPHHHRRLQAVDFRRGIGV